MVTAHFSEQKPQKEETKDSFSVVFNILVHFKTVLCRLCWPNNMNLRITLFGMGFAFSGFEQMASSCRICWEERQNSDHPRLSKHPWHSNNKR